MYLKKNGKVLVLLPDPREMQAMYLQEVETQLKKF